jgi:hypothetical protein
LEAVREVLEANRHRIGDALREVFGEIGLPPALEYVDEQRSAGQTTSSMVYDPYRDVIVANRSVLPYLTRENPNEVLATLGHELGHCYHYRKNLHYRLELPRGRNNATNYAQEHGLITLFDLRAYGESVAYLAEDNIRTKFALAPSVDSFKKTQIQWLHSNSAHPDYGITLLTGTENILGFVFSRILLGRERKFIQEYIQLKSLDALKQLDSVYCSLSPEQKIIFLTGRIEQLTGLKVDFAPLLDALRGQW